MMMNILIIIEYIEVLKDNSYSSKKIVESLNHAVERILKMWPALKSDSNGMDRCL